MTGARKEVLAWLLFKKGEPKLHGESSCIEMTDSLQDTALKGR